MENIIFSFIFLGHFAFFLLCRPSEANLQFPGQHCWLSQQGTDIFLQVWKISDSNPGHQTAWCATENIKIKYSSPLTSSKMPRIVSNLSQNPVPKFDYQLSYFTAGLAIRRFPKYRRVSTRRFSENQRVVTRQFPEYRRVITRWFSKYWVVAHLWKSKLAGFFSTEESRLAGFLSTGEL